MRIPSHQQKRLSEFKELKPISNQMMIDTLKLERMKEYNIMLYKIRQTRDIERKKSLIDRYNKIVKIIDYQISKVKH